MVMYFGQKTIKYYLLVIIYLNLYLMRKMTTIEKLNSLMRLGIYLGLALYLFTGIIEYLYIILIVGLLTYFIYKYQLQNIELYLNSYENSDFNKIQKDSQRGPT